MLSQIHKQPKAIADELAHMLKQLNIIKDDLPSFTEEQDGTITVKYKGKEYTLQPK